MKRPNRNRAKIRAQPPADAKAGADLVRTSSLKVFDLQDGNGANWPLMAESLFRVAFEALDRMPADERGRLARRVEAGAYGRVVDQPATDFQAVEGSAGPAAGVSAAFGVKAPGPDRPGN